MAFFRSLFSPCGLLFGATPMIVIRSCQGQAELEACVQLQVETWGYDPTDVIPRKAFLVWQKVGGQVIGAFDTEIAGAGDEGGPESLVGFVLALPGIKFGAEANAGAAEPRPYLHSHMMAVKEGYRNRGLGVRLKLEQRKDALKRGIRLIEWTFDPLEIKNAFFNVERLGAIVRRYVFNQYGTTTSHLHGGLPTDRCIAEWWIGSPRAQAIIAGGPFERNPIEVRIAIPAEIAGIRVEDPKRAREIQQQASDQFQVAFDRRLAVIGFEKSNQAGTYLLGKWESS